jgi:two-component system, sporulation sensor kinase D
MQNRTALTRWSFILVSIFIIALIIWNTFAFFKQLKENERSKMQIWAEALQEVEKTLLNEDEISPIVTSVLQSNTSTPMLLYNHEDKNYSEKNIDSNAVNSPKKIQKLVEQFSSEYKPIEVTYKNEVLSTIYYGNSPIINKLKYYPATLILILVLFIAAIYFFNKTAKSAEQNRLWAGMAKETAHQIGTPLSSLIGWTEILKTENVNPEYIIEIEKDVHRLETITERFSKVGSTPVLEKKDVVAETKASFEYLKNRTSKLINFDLELPSKPIYVALNEQLYSWTIENLVKNGIDAMKGKGTITIAIEATPKNAIIYIKDTGKGIPKSSFKKVFMPGYTTKKRGWGLGLSLAKRIIEEYHNGKIRVLKSVQGEGTTMAITLRLQK